MKNLKMVWRIDNKMEMIVISFYLKFDSVLLN